MQTFIPIKSVEIDFHGSYNYSKYNQFPVVFNPSGTETPFLYIPKFQYGVTGTYHLPIDDSWGDIAVSATYSWYGHQYDSISVGEAYPIEPSYSLFDWRVDWTNIFGYPIDANFWMKNALNALYVQGAVTIYTQLGFTALSYGPRQMFGFNLKYRFKAESSEEATSAPYTPPPVVAPKPAPSVDHSYMVFFDFNKSDLTPQATAIVDQAAKNAAPANATEITVTGHTDTFGSDAYNMRLSRRRAESVAAELEKQGIPPAKSRSSPKASTICWSRRATAFASRRTRGSPSFTAVK